MKTTNMNSNNLTALLTALAIVPLYFKEPSQSTPEKWEYAAIIVDQFKNGGKGNVILESEHITYIAVEQDDKSWRSVLIEEGRQSKNDDLPLGEGQALMRREGIYERAILKMSAEGWEPFAIAPGKPGDLTQDNIYYRRRVQ